MQFQDLARLVADRPEQGEFSVHRDIFRDPEVFELEMIHIFEGTWVFLGLASQVPKPHDYFTTWIGRSPVVVMRDAKGNLGAFLNTCRHRGAVLCHMQAGNAKYHVCNYHGWAYGSDGRNVYIKDAKTACYSPSFERENHDLVPVARFAEYRGILFGSLNLEVPALEEHLGETRTFIDMVVDQGEQGVELIPGQSSYIYKGNWKLQVENCLDLYHLTSTHPSFMEIVSRRKSGESRHGLKAIDFNEYRKPETVRGSYSFNYGHAMVWGTNTMPEVRPLFADIENVKKRVGELRAKWMLSTRNLTLYPNVQFAENAALQLRVIRPLAVDRTEMTIYCIGAIGESGAAREHRLRQFEDFFNSTGLATPDDTTCYEDCQTGYGGRGFNSGVPWQQGYARGMSAAIKGPDADARELGVRPETSVTGAFDIQDETVFHAGYREWLRLMRQGMAEKAPLVTPDAVAGAALPSKPYKAAA